MDHATHARADRVMDRLLDDAALDVPFRDARTHHAWLTEAVPLARHDGWAVRKQAKPEV